MLRISMVVRRGAHLWGRSSNSDHFSMCGPETPAQPAPSFNNGFILCLQTFLHCAVCFHRASRHFLHCAALLPPRQPLVACQLLIVVANVGLQLDLPH